MLQLKQSYLHPVRCNVPLIVTSAFQGKWIICGSDDGSVRLFDQRSGEMIKCLQHGNCMSFFTSKNYCCKLIKPCTFQLGHSSRLWRSVDHLTLQPNQLTWYVLLRHILTARAVWLSVAPQARALPTSKFGMLRLVLFLFRVSLCILHLYADRARPEAQGWTVTRPQARRMACLLYHAGGICCAEYSYPIHPFCYESGARLLTQSAFAVGWRQYRSFSWGLC